VDVNPYSEIQYAYKICIICTQIYIDRTWWYSWWLTSRSSRFGWWLTWGYSWRTGWLSSWLCGWLCWWLIAWFTWWIAWWLTYKDVMMVILWLIRCISLYIHAVIHIHMYTRLVLYAHKCINIDRTWWHSWWLTSRSSRLRWGLTWGLSGRTTYHVSIDHIH
jgi:hypothetical protein